MTARSNPPGTSALKPEQKAKFVEFLGFRTCDDPELEKMLDGSLEWLTALCTKQPARWITFLGSPGTGKTYLARKLFRIASERFTHVETEYIVRPVYWPDFIQKLRGGNAFAERDDMKRWPVLLLDDIGAERDVSGFAAEELNTLCGCRMNRWTILTSNYKHARMREIDERIASRMIREQNICIEVQAKDFALR